MVVMCTFTVQYTTQNVHKVHYVHFTNTYKSVLFISMLWSLIKYKHSLPLMYKYFNENFMSANKIQMYLVSHTIVNL